MSQPFRPGPSDILTTIGDIGVSATTVYVPGRSFPTKGTTWIVRDQSRTEEKMATWALVVGLLTFWWTCFLGLLFLLIKEHRTTGYVEVDVRNGDVYHVTQIPISNPMQVFSVRQQVDYVRQLSA
jgi:hypothetical protein